MNTPVLIAARNEERLIQSALKSIVHSICLYRKEMLEQENNPKNHESHELTAEFFYNIYICDNNSTDLTVQKIQEFTEEYKHLLNVNNINIECLHEQMRGKIHALRKLIAAVENQRINVDNATICRNVIFTDADVEWESNVYKELTNYKLRNPQIKLVGTR